ncbi:MAG: short-chain fatty acid transporter [Bacteroidales bacterium]|nr:short-chain fatty acid transporter [Bacteroidales bacterium]
MFHRLINFCVKLVQRYLPEPFIFAILLTFVAFLFSVFGMGNPVTNVVTHWGDGVWSLLSFSMQMALVLVCGSALADSEPVRKALVRIARLPKSPVQAIVWVSAVSLVACWINWGFGLIVGVIFAKQIARTVRGVDYRLLIAAAYSGFVVWHSGISASIPLAMATQGKALLDASGGCLTEPVPVSETIFSVFNLVLAAVVMVALIIVNALMHPKGTEVVSVDPKLLEEVNETSEETLLGTGAGRLTPASRLENSRLLTMLVVLLGLSYLFLSLFVQGRSFDLNAVILLFMMLGILLHKTPIRYVQALTAATSSCAGILLQFPFYAGIMGIMTGLSPEGTSIAGQISAWCVQISNQTTFPVVSFLSAGLVNIFVPSGGGQWAVQGPIMIPAGMQLGVSPSVVGLALAWGDAWTNLIQPFWAIPALAIAKLGAKDIMGFCLIDLIVVGVLVCLGFLIVGV